MHASTSITTHGHTRQHEHDGRRGHGHEHAQGIEWEDDMVEVNRMHDAGQHALEARRPRRPAPRTPRSTGSSASATRSRSGSSTRWTPTIRCTTRSTSTAPAASSSSPATASSEPNLVWKDTVLVRTGETVDILLDVTNPGRLDGALPHRRAPRERDDVQLQRRAGGRSRRGVGLSVIDGPRGDPCRQPWKSTPATISTAMIDAATQSTTRQNGGHHRVFATN